MNGVAGSRDACLDVIDVLDLDNIEDLTFFYFTELSALSTILLQVNLK